MKQPTLFSFDLPQHAARLQNLCGPADENIRYLEKVSDLIIERSQAQFRLSTSSGRNTKQISGKIKGMITRVEQCLRQLFEQANIPLEPHDVQLVWAGLSSPKKRERKISPPLKSVSTHPQNSPVIPDSTTVLLTRKKNLQGRTPKQQSYITLIQDHLIVLGIGPAGTGKTFLAVACAVDALERGKVKRLVLTRPAVEAGEKLGFLPGDLSQKIDPYLRPLFDALTELLGYEKTQRYLEKGLIEIAPLAYMRGRTLSDAFVILDEAQNTTHEQMKMFLTRLGVGSTMVITGDLTQQDLKGQTSGLYEAQQVLKNIPEVGIIMFDANDVVRHSLVSKIVLAYAKYEKNSSRSS